jgi:hypothetical protein
MNRIPIKRSAKSKILEELLDIAIDTYKEPMTDIEKKVFIKRFLGKRKVSEPLELISTNPDDFKE